MDQSRISQDLSGSGPGDLENIPDEKWPGDNKHSEVFGANEKPDVETHSQLGEGLFGR